VLARIRWLTKNRAAALPAPWRRGRSFVAPLAIGRHRRRPAGRQASRSDPLWRRPRRRETARPEADRAVENLYEAHYRSLVQVATLLTGDVAIAESVVQAAFVAVHRAWRRLGTCDQGLRYLRKQVVRRARSGRSGRLSADGTRPTGPGSPASLPAAVILRGLPLREREALVLRYLVGLPATEIARLSGVRARTVGRRLRRGLAAIPAAEPDCEAGSGGHALAGEHALAREFGLELPDTRHDRQPG